MAWVTDYLGSSQMRSLTLKLILAFLAVGLIGTAFIALFAWSGTEREFGNLEFDRWRTGFVDQLAEFYVLNGSWLYIEEVFPMFAVGSGPGSHWGPRMGAPILLIDESGEVLFPGQGFKIGDHVSQQTVKKGIPIEVDGKVVGRVIAGRDALSVSPAGEAFLGRVNNVLILGTAGGAVVALLLGVILARTFTRPIRELTAATRAVAAGDLEQQVPIRSKDEIGELTKAFNQMNANLARARDLRRQMTADIAHELRTPLSVILSHTEAIKDGVFEASEETFQIIHDETMRLSTMVEDLRTLSLAETGELSITPRKVKPEELLRQSIAAHTPRAQQKNITLDLQLLDDTQEIEVDPDRMAQVFGNLMDNALRYTPPGGCITLSVVKSSEGIELRVRDNGSGIEPEELAHIFDRFYRVDKSRHRDEGGSGLGLAIAKSIVERHGGQIRAESRPGEGVTFIMEFPIAGSSIG
jgi:two-component system sensor histidine kinase BaeS